jgi:hypothetical protein
MSRLIGTLVAMLAFAVAPFSALAKDGGSCPRPNRGTLIQSAARSVQR